MVDKTKTLDDLKHPQRKLLFTGGKGGVGKTTVASALALALAHAGHKTLLTSTDPAHSLSDSLDMDGPIGHAIRPYPGQDNLHIQELDAEEALDTFRRQHGGALQELIVQATYLDEEDAQQLLQLAIPGLDEIMAFIQITENLESDTYQKIIVDTAPTGHALRLLHFPDLLDDWIKVMAALRQKYFQVIRAFGAKTTAGEPDDWLLVFKKRVKHVRRLLTNRDVTEFVVVARPERMVLSETQRLVQQLEAYGIGLRHLILNGMIPVPPGDDFCGRIRRQHDQQQHEAARLMPGLYQHALPLQPEEVTGLEALQSIGDHLFSNPS